MFVEVFLASLLVSLVIVASVLLFFFSCLSFILVSFVFLVSRVVTSGPSLIAESSKRRGNASAGKKMGKVKRDIPVYTKVMSRTASALPSASLGGSGQSSALVPVTTPPAAPTVDSSVAAICSSPNKKVDGSD